MSEPVAAKANPATRSISNLQLTNSANRTAASPTTAVVVAVLPTGMSAARASAQRTGARPTNVTRSTRHATTRSIMTGARINMPIVTISTRTSTAISTWSDAAAINLPPISAQRDIRQTAIKTNAATHREMINNLTNATGAAASRLIAGRTASISLVRRRPSSRPPTNRQIINSQPRSS